MANTKETTTKEVNPEVESLHKEIAGLQAELANVHNYANELSGQINDLNNSLTVANQLNEDLKHQLQKAYETSATYRNALLTLAREIG